MGRVTCVQLLRESIYLESMRNVEGTKMVVYHCVFSTGCYVVICYVNSSIRVVDGRMVVLPRMRSLGVLVYLVVYASVIKQDTYLIWLSFFLVTLLAWCWVYLYNYVHLMEKGCSLEFIARIHGWRIRSRVYLSYLDVRYCVILFACGPHLTAAIATHPCHMWFWYNWSCVASK